MHHPSDVVAGSELGAGVAMTAWTGASWPQRWSVWADGVGVVRQRRRTVAPVTRKACCYGTCKCIPTSWRSLWGPFAGCFEGSFPIGRGFRYRTSLPNRSPWASPAWATRFRGPCRPGHRGLKPGPLQHCWRRRRLPGPADHLHRRHGHGSLVPLPAGLGAVETAMTVGLTVAGTAAAPASAAVLLYRLFFHRKRRRPRVAGGRGPTRTRRRSSPFSRHPIT